MAVAITATTVWQLHAQWQVEKQAKTAQKIVLVNNLQFRMFSHIFCLETVIDIIFKLTVAQNLNWHACMVVH